MKEIKEIKEIKIPEGVDSIAVKHHDDRIVIEFIPEKPKFKEGDFVYEDGRIMIVKNYPDNYYALIYPKLDMKPVYNGRYAPTMPLSSLSLRYATENEKQLLIDAMEKDGKLWNAEKLKIEDILKNGDLAIFWNEETLPDEDAIIARYNCADIIDSVTSHHSADGGIYNFAVKWDGTKEQFEKILRGEIN